MSVRDPALDRPPATSPYANEGEVSETDRPALPSATGREEGRVPDEPKSDFEAEVDSHPVGDRPRSEITGKHEPGTGDETDDGLDPTAESVRREAEDLPVGGRDDAA